MYQVCNIKRQDGGRGTRCDSQSSIPSPSRRFRPSNRIVVSCGQTCFHIIPGTTGITLLPGTVPRKTCSYRIGTCTIHSRRAKWISIRRLLQYQVIWKTVKTPSDRCRWCARPLNTESVAVEYLGRMYIQIAWCMHHDSYVMIRRRNHLPVFWTTARFGQNQYRCVPVPVLLYLVCTIMGDQYGGEAVTPAAGAAVPPIRRLLYLWSRYCSSTMPGTVGALYIDYIRHGENAFRIDAGISAPFSYVRIESKKGRSKDNKWSR